METVRGRQRVGVVAEVVLAELTGVVAKVEQELGNQ
jgi:predicted amino acid-binding ACT domain protein